MKYINGQKEWEKDYRVRHPETQVGGDELELRKLYLLSVIADTLHDIRDHQLRRKS